MAGCAHSATDIVKEPVWCVCGSNETWIECQAQNVSYTCQTTKCVSCGRYLAGPRDEVWMSGFSRGIRVRRFAN